MRFKKSIFGESLTSSKLILAKAWLLILPGPSKQYSGVSVSLQLFNIFFNMIHNYQCVILMFAMFPVGVYPFPFMFWPPLVTRILNLNILFIESEHIFCG